MRRGDTDVNRDVLWASAAAAAEELLHHKKRNLDMALYTDLALQDSVKEQLFRWAKAYHPNCHLEKMCFYSVKFLSLYWQTDNNRDLLFVSGVSSTRWRRNAAPEWRSWGLWLESTCRTGSLFQRSWRKRSPSSPWEKPCCRTTATPNIQGTFCVCFLTQRKTWLLCAFNDEEE